MTTTTRGGSVLSKLPPTLGPQVCRWMEANLVHGEGDYYGQSFRLRAWQRAFIYRAYELDVDGSRLVKDTLQASCDHVAAARALGLELAERLKAAGAAEILRQLASPTEPEAP